MTGRVLPTREPVLPVKVQGPSGRSLDIEALVDSGFTGQVTLPRRALEQLALDYTGLAVGTLADGSRVVARKFTAAVVWHGTPRGIVVLESEGGPMIGMSLLYGSRVAFDARDEGTLTIEPLVAS